MQFDSRIKLNVFQGETTYKNDYRIVTLDKKRHLHKWHKERTEKVGTLGKGARPANKYTPECHESMTKYKEGVHVPFNLLWPEISLSEAKHPGRTILQIPVDHDDLAEVIKTRPRLSISPCAAIDDITDPDMRNLLLNYMYTTNFRKTEKDAVAYLLEKKKTVKAKYCHEGKKEFEFMVKDMPRPPVRKLHASIFPTLPPGWRPHFETWDVKQNRALAHPTRNFWVHKDPPVKSGGDGKDPMRGLVPLEKQEEILSLIESDQLRMPHDKTMQWYCGYQPNVPRGVPLKATNFEVTHPLLTTSQAFTSRYEQDTRENK